jgi:hypothetical protein
MRAARIVAIAALVFLGLSAIVGAIPPLTRPTDEAWAMAQRLLRHSPFHSYLIHSTGGERLAEPAGALWLTVQKDSVYGWWVTARGCVLSGWLIVEMAMLRLVVWTQP